MFQRINALHSAQIYKIIIYPLNIFTHKPHTADCCFLVIVISVIPVIVVMDVSLTQGEGNTLDIKINQFVTALPNVATGYIVASNYKQHNCRSNCLKFVVAHLVKFEFSTSQIST